VGRQLQSALTKEVELVKHGELVAELVKLHLPPRIAARPLQRVLWNEHLRTQQTAPPLQGLQGLGALTG
jgi:hypothetical protein